MFDNGWMDQPRRPSKAWYFVGGAAIVICIGAAVGWGVSAAFNFIDRIDNFQRVAVPGEGTVTFDDAGGYTLYYEAPGASGGPLPPVEVSLTPASGGEAVPFDDYTGDLTYNVNNHEGRAVLTFDIHQPGDYVLETSTDGPGAGDVAVGRSLTRGLPRVIVGVVLLCILGLALGALVITITAVKRHQAGRSRNA